MAKNIQRDGAGEVGQVFKFHPAERNGFSRHVKSDRARGIRHALALEHDLQAGDVQVRLVDDEGGSAGRPGCKADLPGPSAIAQVLVEGEAAHVNRQGQQQPDQNRFPQVA